MAASNKILSGGNKYAFGGFLDEFGFLKGGTPTAPSAGATGSPMFQIVGIQTAAPTVPERETIPVLGDDELLGEIPITSITSRRFTIEMAVQDLTVEGYMQDTNVETFGEVLMGVLDSLNEAELDMCYLLQSRALKQDSGVQGKKAWGGIIVPLATGTPLGRRTFGSREAAAYAIDVTPQIAGYNPFGLTILDSNAGTTGLRYRPFHSDYPVIMERWTGTGALSTFTLSKTPVSAAKVFVAVERVAATVSSVSTATPSMTLGSAPANGARIVALYEWVP